MLNINFFFLNKIFREKCLNRYFLFLLKFKKIKTIFGARNQYFVTILRLLLDRRREVYPSWQSNWSELNNKSNREKRKHEWNEFLGFLKNMFLTIVEKFNISLVLKKIPVEAKQSQAKDNFTTSAWNDASLQNIDYSNFRETVTLVIFRMVTFRLGDMPSLGYL